LPGSEFTITEFAAFSSSKPLQIETELASDSNLGLRVTGGFTFGPK